MTARVCPGAAGACWRAPAGLRVGPATVSSSERLAEPHHGVVLCACGDQWQAACASWWLQRHREAAAPDAWGAARRQIINETLPALAKLRKEGTVRYVGFSGLPLDAFKYILDRRAPGARAGAGASTPALQGCGLRARRSHRLAAPRLSQGRRCSAAG